MHELGPSVIELGPSMKRFALQWQWSNKWIEGSAVCIHCGRPIRRTEVGWYHSWNGMAQCRGVGGTDAKPWLAVVTWEEEKI